MISVNFVNGFQLGSYIDSDYLEMKDAIAHESEFVENMIDTVIYNYDKAMLEYAITESEHETALILESDGKNIFTRIGEAILGMFKKINELVGKFIDFLSGKNTEVQSESQRLDSLLKEINSDAIKNDIIYHVNKGDLNLSNARTIQDVRKAYDELMAMSSQDDVKTFKGKVKKFLHLTKPDEEYEKNNGGKFLVAIKAATGVLALTKGALELRKTIKEIRDGTEKSSKATKKALDAANITKAQADARKAQADAELAEMRRDNYKSKSSNRADSEKGTPRNKNISKTNTTTKVQPKDDKGHVTESSSQNELLRSLVGYNIMTEGSYEGENSTRLEKARLIQQAANAYTSYMNDVLAATKRIEKSRREGLNRFFNRWDPKNKSSQNDNSNNNE